MILAFDLETRLLASEVAERHASELGGVSAWEHPALFGFACGVAIDVDTGAPRYYGPAQAVEMIAALEAAEQTVGYNSASFDLGVLSAYGDVDLVRDHHVDLCTLVREQLDALATKKQTVHRLRQGGLDGLARANGLAGKEGDGVRAVELYRDGKLTDLLDYCEADTSLAVDLYRLARKQGDLQVDPYHHNESRERIYLPRVTLPISL